MKSGRNGSGCDQFCEQQSKPFYAYRMGRASLAPGVYYRLLLLGFFEGIDSERGIAWRAAHSLSLWQFLHHGIDETTPDHVTISQTKRLIGEETRRQVFGWVLDNEFT